LPLVPSWFLTPFLLKVLYNDLTHPSHVHKISLTLPSFLLFHLVYNDELTFFVNYNLYSQPFTSTPKYPLFILLHFHPPFYFHIKKTYLFVSLFVPQIICIGVLSIFFTFIYFFMSPTKFSISSSVQLLGSGTISKDTLLLFKIIIFLSLDRKSTRLNSSHVS